MVEHAGKACADPRKVWHHETKTTKIYILRGEPNHMTPCRELCNNVPRNRMPYCTGGDIAALLPGGRRCDLSSSINRSTMRLNSNVMSYNYDQKLNNRINFIVLATL